MTDADHPLRFAAHTFAALADAPFDVAAYSRLKFGSDRSAKALGADLADRFMAVHRAVLARRCVVVPAPSTPVPVAATLLSVHFTRRVNARLVADGGRPVVWCQAHREVTYNDNYADLPGEDRRRLLAADRVYLNRDFLAGKCVLFVDDCRITGAHEEKLAGVLRQAGLSDPHGFVCYAAYAGDDPAVEGRLNHAAVRTVEDLVELAREPGHRVTTRAVRLLLQADPDRLPAVLAAAPPAFVEEAYHAAVTKHYHTHYPDAFERLARAAAELPGAGG